MGDTKLLLRGTFTVFTFIILGLFASYLFRILLTKTLTLEDFGLYSAIFAFITMLQGLKSIGIGSALVRYVTEYRVANNNQGVKDLLASFFFIQAIIAGIFFLIVLFFAPTIAEIYFHTKNAALPLVLFTASVLFATITTTCRGLFQAYKNMLYLSLTDFLPVFLQLILTLLLFLYTDTILAPIIAYLLSSILLALWSYWAARKTFPFQNVRTRISFALLKKLFTYTAPVIAGTLSFSIVRSLDIIILTYFRTLAEVGLYSIALPTAHLLQYFPKALISTLFPIISEQHVKKTSTLPNLLARTYTILLALMIPPTLLFIAFPELIISTIFGSRFLDAAPALQFLSIAMLLSTFTLINQYALLALEQPKAYATTAIVGTILTIIFNLLLVQPYGFIGTSIATLLGNLAFFTITLRSVRTIITFQFPLKHWASTLLAGALFLAVVLATKNVLTTNRYAEAIIAASLATLLYGATLHTLKVLTLSEAKTLINSAYAKSSHK